MKNQKAHDILENTGLKKTSGRIAILNCLLKEKNPLSQQEIAEKLREFKINEASIYRALEAFDRTGIVHRVEGLDKTWRFAVSSRTLEKGYHPHFICVDCGRVECFRELEIPRLRLNNSNYVIKSQEMILKGSCEKCSS